MGKEFYEGKRKIFCKMDPIWLVSLATSKNMGICIENVYKSPTYDIEYDCKDISTQFLKWEISINFNLKLENDVFGEVQLCTKSFEQLTFYTHLFLIEIPAYFVLFFLPFKTMSNALSLKNEILIISEIKVSDLMVNWLFSLTYPPINRPSSFVYQTHMIFNVFLYEYIYKL